MRHRTLTYVEGVSQPVYADETHFPPRHRGSVTQSGHRGGHAAPTCVPSATTPRKRGRAFTSHRSVWGKVARCSMACAPVLTATTYRTPAFIPEARSSS